MNKIKKEFSFTTDRQIWRLIPTNTNKLIVEDRDKNTKEAFFNCLDICNSKIIFKNFQIEDNFWIGIETVYNDIIFFHKYLKPDMPMHSGLIAYDINSKKVIWKNDEYNFLFINDSKVYTFKNKFEGREYVVLDFKTGDILEKHEDDSEKINILREYELSKNNFKEYLFPQTVDLSGSYSFIDILNELRIEKVITGKIDFIEHKDLLFISFHEILSNGKLKNIFRAVEISSKKIILEEILDNETKLFIPESFFVRNNLVFLIKEKVKLIIYSF